jgi:four helix bundle suffix protein
MTRKTLTHEQLTHDLKNSHAAPNSPTKRNPTMPKPLFTKAGGYRKLHSFTFDTMHDYWCYYHQVVKPYSRWLNNDDPVVVANAMIVLILRGMGMLDKQMERLGRDFLQEGGFKERMYACRSDARDQAASPEPAAPVCPVCGGPMRKRFPRNGSDKNTPFWGCSRYPGCHGTRPFHDSAAKKKET